MLYFRELHNAKAAVKLEFRIVVIKHVKKTPHKRTKLDP